MHETSDRRVGGFTEGTEREAVEYDLPQTTAQVSILYPVAVPSSPRCLPRATSNILGKVKPHEP